MRASRLVGLSVSALLAACSGTGVPAPQSVQQELTLVGFDSCPALEKYIQDTAVLDMRSSLEQSKELYRGGPILAEGGEDAGGTPSTSSGGPSAYTTTNTQVAGVDEADFVKNDGTRIFVLTGRTLYLNQSWPADQLRTVAKLDVEGWPREMYLDENNHVVVFSEVYTPAPADPSANMPIDGWCAGWGPYGYCGSYGSVTLKTTVVDVADLAHPRVTSELYQPGSYTASRRVGPSVRMVTANSFRWPAGVRWWPDLTADLYNDKAARDRAFDALISKNEQLIRATKLQDWLPQSYYRAADGSLVQLPYDCTEFHRPNAPTKLGVVSVATLDLSPQTLAAQGHPGMSRTSIIAQSGQIYSSLTGLYLASEHWWWWPEPGQVNHTYLYKFNLTDPQGASFVAAGGVDGHIVNQFAMDEQDGYLRVATTLYTRVEDPTNSWGRLETTNRISVLANQGGKLKVVGQSEEIAPNEYLYGARFIGNKGFVVTFRSVDPLFTFDLSDPTHPRKVGELQVPGFSTYLHPIDENHIMTIGEYVPPNNPSWQARSLKLSIFDVSDFANPKETATQLVGTAYGWSDALWDHKAFNYFPERKLLAIPFFDWTSNGGYYWDSFISELRVFSVDPVTGFTPRGALTMKDVYQEVNYENWTWYWTPMIRRSVMADDFVYAVADSGIRVANVNSLDQPIATVLFPPYVGP